MPDISPKIHTHMPKEVVWHWCDPSQWWSPWEGRGLSYRHHHNTSSSPATDNRWEGGGHSATEGQWHFPTDQTPPPPTLKRADSKNGIIKEKRCHVLRLWIKRATPHCNANKLLCLSEMAFCLHHLCPNTTLELPYESPLQTHSAKNGPHSLRNRGVQSVPRSFQRKQPKAVKFIVSRKLCFLVAL